MTVAPETKSADTTSATIDELQEELRLTWEMLGEAIADSSHAYKELEVTRTERNHLQSELVKAHATIAALEDDLNRKPDHSREAQLETELTKTRATLASVSKTFQDVTRLTMPLIGGGDYSMSPLASTFNLIDDTLASSEHLLTPVVLAVDKTIA